MESLTAAPRQGLVKKCLGYSYALEDLLAPAGDADRPAAPGDLSLGIQQYGFQATARQLDRTHQPYRAGARQNHFLPTSHAEAPPEIIALSLVVRKCCLPRHSILVAHEEVPNPLDYGLIERQLLARESILLRGIVLERVACLGQLDEFCAPRPVAVHQINQYLKVAATHDPVVF